MKYARLVYALIALTIFDGLATYFEVKHGYAAEANPLLTIMPIGPAMLARVGVGVALALMLGYLAERTKITKFCLITSVVVHSAVALYHIVGMTVVAWL